MTRPPAVDQTLVDWLDVQFPDTLPLAEGTSEQLLHQLLRKQGERSVVSHVKALLTRQESKSLRTIL